MLYLKIIYNPIGINIQIQTDNFFFILTRLLRSIFANFCLLNALFCNKLVC